MLMALQVNTEFFSGRLFRPVSAFGSDNTGRDNTGHIGCVCWVLTARAFLQRACILLKLNWQRLPCCCCS
jgi:hypothetical protein